MIFWLRRWHTRRPEVLARRSGDVRVGKLGRVNVRENWYRDLWLIIITGWIAYVGILTLDLTRQIQHNRLEVIRRECVEQNMRHDATVALLHVRVANAQRQGLALLLVNDLAPRQNCDAIVKRARLP